MAQIYAPPGFPSVVGSTSHLVYERLDLRLETANVRLACTRHNDAASSRDLDIWTGHGTARFRSHGTHDCVLDLMDPPRPKKPGWEAHARAFAGTVLGALEATCVAIPEAQLQQGALTGMGEADQALVHGELPTAAGLTTVCDNFGPGLLGLARTIVSARDRDTGLREAAALRKRRLAQLRSLPEGTLLVHRGSRLRVRGGPEVPWGAGEALPRHVLGSDLPRGSFPAADRRGGFLPDDAETSGRTEEPPLLSSHHRGAGTGEQARATLPGPHPVEGRGPRDRLRMKDLAHRLGRKQRSASPVAMPAA